MKPVKPRKYRQLGPATWKGLSRRDLLQRGAVGAGLAIAPSALSACGGGDDGASSTVAAADNPGVASGTVSYYSWQGEDFADQTKAWRERHDVELKSLYYSDPSEFETKFLSGGGRGLYNLGTVCACYGSRYQDLELLTPIDVDSLSNYEHLYPFFREGPLTEAWTFDGQTWAVPVTWAADSLLYDSSQVDAPSSYDDLLEPAFENRFAFYDDPYGAVMIGARALGVGKPDDGLYTESDLEQIFDYLRPFKDQARLIADAGEVAELFGSREIVATTIAWFGILDFAAAKGNQDVKSATPMEGGYTYIDAYFIPPGAKDVETAHDYINYAISKKVQADGASALAGGVVRPDAVPLLDNATRSLYPYDDLELVFEDLPLLVHPPLEPEGDYVSFEMLLGQWDDFKAS